MDLARANYPVDNICNLIGKEGGYGVSYLYVLLRPVTDKEVVIRERLDTSCFSYCEAATLQRIIVDKVMTIL